VTVEDDLPQREFQGFAPKDYDSDTPIPLMIHLHGQYGDAKQNARDSDYVDLDWHGLWLQGIGEEDAERRGCGTGFYLGEQVHDSQTCGPFAWYQTCCYKSCRAQGKCSGDGWRANCGWTSCRDDVAFVREALDQVMARYCVDMDRVYARGFSNGGMFTHYLASKLPRTFRAVFPAAGMPLDGYLDVPEAVSGFTDILHLHGRRDTYVPVNGGEGGGWYYEKVQDILDAWAQRKGCAGNSRSVNTPFDGGRQNLACSGWDSCNDGGQVLLCLYDGTHSDYFDDRVELHSWFANQQADLNVGGEASESAEESPSPAPEQTPAPEQIPAPEQTPASEEETEEEDSTDKKEEKKTRRSRRARRARRTRAPKPAKAPKPKLPFFL